MRNQCYLFLLLPALACAGCSAKDPPNNTPVYDAGTPTNRSTTNSWEPHGTPFYTQPGVNGGKAVTLKPIASQRRFEPYDRVAEQVYNALNADPSLPGRYLSASAKNGVVILSGRVQTAQEKARAIQIAAGVAGVRQVRSHIQVAAPAGGQP